MKRKCNDCGACPYYSTSTDYFGELDEWCEIGYPYRKMTKCRHSLLIRKILNVIWKIKSRYYEWCAERNYLKEEKFRYNERVKLGMTEEEYEQWEYDEMIKN